MAKGKGGAPLGNTNAVRHGARSETIQTGKRLSAELNKAKTRKRKQLDATRRKARRRITEILKSAGLDDDRTARYIGRQLSRLEGMAERLETTLETRGYVQRDGNPKPAAKLHLDVTSKILAVMTSLLEGGGMLRTKPTDHSDVDRWLDGIADCPSPSPMPGTERAGGEGPYTGEPLDSQPSAAEIIRERVPPDERAPAPRLKPAVPPEPKPVEKSKPNGTPDAPRKRTANPWPCADW